MTQQFVVCTMVFVFVNIITTVTYTTLAEIFLKPQVSKELEHVVSLEILDLIYTCLIIFVGIRIYALFIGNNMNDHTLGRLLNPGGYRTKLQVLAVLILIETSCIFCFMLYASFKLFKINSSVPSILIFLILIAIGLNVANIYLINQLHPDLIGRKYRYEVANYINKVESSQVANAENLSVNM